MPDRSLYLRGLRTSIRTNATAFGYSVLATATLTTLAYYLGSPSPWEIFLFILGSTTGFTGLEAAVSDLFQKRMRGDRSDVVVLGSAMNVLALSLSYAVIVLLSWSWSSTWNWLVAPLLGSTIYLMLVGIEMALAAKAQEDDRSGGG